MAKSSMGFVNFSGGEATPKIYGRYDVDFYKTMAETLENVVVNKYGSAVRTPGSYFVARTKNIDKKTRFIPFIFSTSQSYVLEFGEYYIRFFQNGGSVVETSQAITGATQANPVVITINGHGYSDGDAVDISGISGMTELNGKRFLVNNSTSNTFELQDEDGNNIDGTGYTAYGSGGTCAKVYEVVTPYTENDLAGLDFTQQADIMYLFHEDYAIRKLARSGDTSWALTAPTIEGGPFRPVNTTAVTITPSATTGSITLTASSALFYSEHEGAIWQITHGATTGYVTIDTVGSPYPSTTASATVVVDLGNTTATDDWAEGAWSDYRGYPSKGKFFEQRLMVAANTTQPLTVWGSVVEEYENFTAGTDDDDSFSYTLGSKTVDKINWLYPTEVVNVGSPGGPFTMSSGSASAPITPTSVAVRQRNEDGSDDITPVRIGPYIYYVLRNGEFLGQFRYDFDTDSYRTEDMTLLSDHVLDSGVKEFALMNFPDNLVWCVLNDGSVSVFSRDTEQNTRAWSRMEFSGTDAEAETVAVIPNGAEDQAWFVVSRTVDGGTVKYVEYLKPFSVDDQEDMFFVHSGLTYDSTPATTFSNLDHLEGESVQVLADGAVHPNCTVASGSITLNYSASVVHVGLGYTSTIKTMDLEAGADRGSAQTKPALISQVYVRFYRSLGCSVGNETTQDVIPFRTGAMDMDNAVSLFSGDKLVQFQSGWRKAKHIVITQAQPLPLHILGVFPRMTVSG